MSFRFIITCQLSGKMNIQGHRKNQPYNKNIIDCPGRPWASCPFTNLSVNLKLHKTFPIDYYKIEFNQQNIDYKKWSFIVPRAVIVKPFSVQVPTKYFRLCTRTFSARTIQLCLHSVKAAYANKQVCLIKLYLKQAVDQICLWTLNFQRLF